MARIEQQAVPGIVIPGGSLVTPGGAQGPPGSPGPAGSGSGDVTGPASSVDGEVVSFNATTGKIIKASGGKLTANLVTGPASATTARIATFNGTTGKIIQDGGKLAADLVVGPASATSGRIASYGDATGKLIADGGKLTADLVTGPASATDGDLAVFSGATGKVLKVPSAAELLAELGPTIWGVRLNSFNAVQNPNFEVDQLNCGAVVANNTSAYPCDRWWMGITGTMRVSTQQTVASPAIVFPGTNFNVSSKYMRLTLTTQQASLGASDSLAIATTVEGCNLRELLGGVHSMSLLVRSSVANLKFAVALNDVAGAWSLTKLCTMGAANTWTLITLPNLPVWTGSVTWPVTAGAPAYLLYITLAAGTTVTAAPGSWVAGAKVGATGMDNFANSALSSTFDVAFVQHEPGDTCTTLIDKPFTVNYDECLRYYCKSYNYATAVGTVTGIGAKTLIAPVTSATQGFGPVSWPKSLVRAPTVTFYNTSTGAANSVFDGSASHASPVAQVVGETGFDYITFTTGVSAPRQIYIQYKADCNF
jgi:hypothetical protein